VKIILESLCYNKSIININLSKNKINNVGKTIFECFSLNQTLERVDLSNNNLSEEDITCIISSLDKNSSIKMIKLNDNQVEFPILNILEKQNKNLYDLIEENKFFKNSNYINPLLHYFTYNLMINHLNLRRIGISFEDKKNIGLKFISKFLFFEKKLEKLDLSSCALNDFNSNDLFISLHSNNSVKSLDLSDNLFSSSISKQIRKLFVNKTTLTAPIVPSREKNRFSRK
jgi:Ran GTPase-activating protein (RanGAP) involved in mRNA processing and transport